MNPEFPMSSFRAIALFGVLTLAACRKEVKVDQSDILAEIGERRIRVEDLKGELERRRARQMPDIGKEELLKEMAVHEALLQYALQQRIDQDPEVKREIANLLIGHLKARDLQPKLEAIKVTEEEIQSASEASRDEWVTPAKLRMSIIRIARSPMTSEGKAAESKERLAKAAVMAAGPEGFAAAAAAFSEDQASRYRGGDVGWTEQAKPHGRLPMEVLDAGHALAADGEISGVIEAEDGWYLVTRTAAAPASGLPPDQLGHLLRAEILKAKRSKVDADFKQTVASSVLVRLFPEHLGKIPWERPAPELPPANP
jgi:parvulin-like peptidyl-prolyl isomerase